MCPPVSGPAEPSVVAWVVGWVMAGHVFHDNRHKQYCAKGEWVGKTAGGVPR